MKALSCGPAVAVLALVGCSSGSVGPAQNQLSGDESGSQAGSGSSESGSSSSATASSGGPTGVTGASGGASGSTTSPVVVEQTWRLTDTEYANTINDLLGIAPSSQTVPLAADSSAGGFAVGAEQGDAVAQAYHDSAVALATLAVANITQLLQPVNCSVSAGASCASAFINYYAPLAYRHGTVDAATITGLNGVYATVSSATGGTATLGIQAVLEAMMQSPYFLYKLETEQQALGVGLVPVTGYSMANRLSYLLWGSMPDTALSAAAAANQLTTPAQVSAQATRMIANAKAHVGLANFYSQWMQPVPLQATKDGNSTQITTQGSLSTASLFTYSTGISTGESFATIYTAALQQDILASFNAQLDAALWAPSGAMKTLLTGTTVYANAALAPLFGVTATGTALQPVTVDSTKRIGILSHPLLMATYATPNTSHPIKRGRFVWDQILCQALPDPPPNVPPFAPPAVGMSLRQDYEFMTATGPYAGQTRLGTNGAPLACPECHSRINPVGFLFEPFDTIGDYRTIDDYGQPVDLTSLTIVQAADTKLNVLTPNSIQFAQNLAASDLPNSCLTQQLYRFMAHRADAAADFPVEAQLDTIFDTAGESMAPVLVGLTQTAVFLSRMNAQ
jgi:Protein of unknown function (DUF1592)/Protein of unknown function (DUF1588)/Protein of unknown function (DUF1595)/Protein of unknown function (DUF1587)